MTRRWYAAAERLDELGERLEAHLERGHKRASLPVADLEFLLEEATLLHQLRRRVRNHEWLDAQRLIDDPEPPRRYAPPGVDSFYVPIVGCHCDGVGVGTHANQMTFPCPAHMAHYGVQRDRAGLSTSISVDRCLAPEIALLWAAGIRTTGCCCGHGARDGFIGVLWDDIPAMLALGYQVAPNPCLPDACDSFYPMSMARVPS